MAWVKRTFKRDWLQRSPMLNTVSYKHELSNSTRWAVKPEKEGIDQRDLNAEDYMPYEQMFATFEVTFSIGRHLVKIHANRDIGPRDALIDYVSKLELMRDLFSRFLYEYRNHYDLNKTWVLREFLNPETGPNAVYTSSLSIGTSPTHDFFFAIASCDDKALLTEKKEKDFIEVVVKLTKFFTSAITDAKAAMDTYKGRL